MYSKPNIAKLRDHLIDIVNRDGSFGSSPEALAVEMLYQQLKVYFTEEDIKNLIKEMRPAEENKEYSRLYKILFGSTDMLPLFLTDDLKPVTLWRLSLINDGEIPY